MTWGHRCSFPRLDFRPGLQLRLSLFAKRAQGKPGAECTRSPGATKESPPVSPLRVQPVIPAFPARWCYGFLRALPGERRLLSPLPRRHGPARIDATVAAPGPHDFAVRGRCLVRQETRLTPAASIASRAQRYVTMRSAPPEECGTGRVVTEIGILVKGNIFDGGGLTNRFGEPEAASSNFACRRS